MKPIRLTRHAKNRMRWRRVAEEEVTKVLGAPEWTESTRFGRMNAFAEVEGRLIKVTYVDEEDALIVISVLATERGGAVT